MNLDLENKNALVCGSTQGIGQAIAVELANLGANVTLLARNKNKLTETIQILDVSKGQKHSYIIADFRDLNVLKQQLQIFTKDLDFLHILINNTGGPAAGKILDAQEQDFLAAFTQHLLANQLLTQLLVPFMQKANYGRIVNIISTSVREPLENLGVSNTTRGAVAAWAKTLSKELAAFGITVNNVLPGATDTQRLQNIIANKAQKNGISIEAAAQEMKAEIPAGRFATAQEIAEVAAFLCTPSAAYINGTSIPVDGGRMKCI